MDLSERNSGDMTTRHPWEAARARFFSTVVERSLAREKRISWLDVGAGDAWLALRLLDELPNGSAMTCWDQNFEEADLRQLRNSNPDVSFVKERPGKLFDVISLLDVLEHIENDEEFLASTIEECLLPGGLVIFSVPAYGSLYTRHDTALGHFRRYEPSGIRSVLRGSGLTILRDGGLFTSLLPVRVGEAALERLSRRSSGPTGVGAWGGGPVVTEAICRILVADSWLSLWLAERSMRLPGLSYWAVCQK